MGRRRSVVSVMVTLVLAAAWIHLGPAPLGGAASYVSTFGTSMEPTYTASDLVVLTRQTGYGIGDVVAYRSEQLDTVVMHRIVAEDAAGFITQGDANDWLDDDRPTDADILGAPLFHVPGAGRLLDVPVPVRAAAVTALAALALGGGGKLSRRRARRPTSTTGTPIVTSSPRRRRSAGPTPSEAPLDGVPTVPVDTEASGEAPTRRLAWVGWPSRAAATATVVGLLSVALAATAFTRPVTTSGDVTYTHRGDFTYTADAPTSLVYPTGRLVTGDPVFLRQVDELDLGFTYGLDESDAGSSVTGRLWLDLADGSGWSQRSPLGAASTSDGGPLTLTGRLTVPELQRTLTRVADATGFGGGSATITVSAEVVVDGSIRGTAFTDAFTPELQFQLDADRLVPRDDANASDPTLQGPASDAAVDGTGADADTTEAETIVRTAEGTITVADAEPAQFSFAGRSLSISDARTTAATGLAAALLAVLVGLVGAARQRGFDEAARTRARYGRRLVEVDAVTTPAGYGIVDVRDVTTLVALADRIDRPVLHHRPEPPEPETFIVEGDATVYRYRFALPVAGDPLTATDEQAACLVGSAPQAPSPPKPPPSPPSPPSAATAPPPAVAMTSVVANSSRRSAGPSPRELTRARVHAEMERWSAGSVPRPTDPSTADPPGSASPLGRG